MTSSAPVLNSLSVNHMRHLQVGHLSREVWPRLPGTLSHAPMVLLVNRSTASASEVLAGALRDNGRSATRSARLG